jgi:Fibronectin type III domain
VPEAAEVQKEGQSKEKSVLKISGKGGFALRAHVLPHLTPGDCFRFRVASVNIAGQSEWSKPSYSTTIAPKPPDQPEPPKAVESTLYTMTFRWPVPGDGGAAIDCYRIFVEGLPGQPVQVSRNLVTYTVKGLNPGKAYRAKVRARNCAGWSRYSAFGEATCTSTGMCVCRRRDLQKIRRGLVGGI